MTRRLLILLGIGVLCSGPQYALASDYEKMLARSFSQFCSLWMSKLDQREERNQKIAKAAQNGSGVVLEYTAYADSPESCEVKSVGSNGAMVGHIVYHELVVQKHGATREKARRSKESVVGRTEVMEIFRFDGKAWLY